MVRSGVLCPAESGEFVARNAVHVKIHNEGLNKLAKEVISSMKHGKLEIPESGGENIHPSKDHPKGVDWIFVTDALNFCFWTEKDYTKWKVEGHTGYYALEAALSRAIKDGYDITNPVYYSKITEKELKHLMRGDNDVEIPLLQKRLTVLHEVGNVLLDKYAGTFEECVKQANKSAFCLLDIVVANFECFRDEVTFKGKSLSFYKRAQILVADLWNFYEGKNWGEFNDIDTMTMFADYRVPQVLVYFGVLSYTEELYTLLNNDVILENGSAEEIEIRGCSIHAVELLKKEIRIMLEMSNMKDLEVPNSALIDYYLWCYRRKYADSLEHIPFHKVLSIYY